MWTDADYYYEDHVDNVWSIIISVLLNERWGEGDGVAAAEGNGMEVEACSSYNRKEKCVAFIYAYTQ